MKHLRLFEDHEGKLFWELNEDIYKKKLYGNGNGNHLSRNRGIINWDYDYINSNWLDFTDKEIETIRDILHNEYKRKLQVRKYDYDDDKYIKIKKAQLTIPSLDKYLSGLGYDNIYITKTKDEWYYVSNDDESYQCDQWDGLLNCLDYVKEREDWFPRRPLI